MEQNRTSTGLRQNVAAMLCYAGGWATGIIFLLLEHENLTIRFHAMQSILSAGFIHLVSVVGGFLLSLTPLDKSNAITFSWVVFSIGVISWIVLMVLAYRGSRYKIPLFGDLAEKMAEGRPQPPRK
ncbi:MAG: hypothetical protein A2147_02010 [Chloroflexi bacterium RBG_16_57_8]|nr:MAG: hypothetical protein A2147_02010 [Chloroflexi bacterium RBG_16_57_8]